MELLSNDISNWVKSGGSTETAYVLTFRNSADGGEGEKESPPTTTTANADTGDYWQGGGWFDAIASNLGSWFSGVGNIIAGTQGNSSGNTTPTVPPYYTNTDKNKSEDESDKTTTIIIIVAVLIVVILAVFLLMRKK